MVKEEPAAEGTEEVPEGGRRQMWRRKETGYIATIRGTAPRTLSQWSRSRGAHLWRSGAKEGSLDAGEKRSSAGESGV